MDLTTAFQDIERRTSSTIGVTDTSPFPEDEERLVDRVTRGLHGGLSFTYAAPDIAARPAVSFPWASSIVIAAVPYLREGDGGREGRTVARFADGDRYVHLRTVLAEIDAVLRAGEYRTEVVYDDRRLIDRAVAVRAGVAWLGKSTMVLTPGAGPWILLGSVVTDASLPASSPMRRTCGTCDECIPACPTDAIISPGVLDAGRCISAVLQRRGTIEPELREAIGGRIYGCDECLTACPPGRPALRERSVQLDPLTPEQVLMATDEELEHAVEHWYVPSRRMRFVRRNALVALGNTGNESSLELLSSYLAGHQRNNDSLLAAHAAWAIGRIGGAVASGICTAALEDETDETVIDELCQAIDASALGGVYAGGLSAPRPFDLEETPR